MEPVTATQALLDALGVLLVVWVCIIGAIIVDIIRIRRGR